MNTRACNCTHSCSAFVASLIPQDWMQAAKHCPAVRCRCGKQYYSFAEKRAFASRSGVERRTLEDYEQTGEEQLK